MTEYRLTIQHIDDGKHTGTDYATLSEDEYQTIMKLLVSEKLGK